MNSVLRGPRSRSDNQTLTKIPELAGMGVYHAKLKNLNKDKHCWHNGKWRLHTSYSYEEIVMLLLMFKKNKCFAPVSAWPALRVWLNNGHMKSIAINISSTNWRTFYLNQSQWALVWKMRRLRGRLLRTAAPYSVCKHTFVPFRKFWQLQESGNAPLSVRIENALNALAQGTKRSMLEDGSLIFEDTESYFNFHLSFS